MRCQERSLIEEGLNRLSGDEAGLQADRTNAVGAW